MAQIKAPDMTRPPSLIDYAPQWLAGLQLRPSTVERYAAALGHHILPELGQVRVDRLTRPTVQNWCAWASVRIRANGERYAHATVMGWWRICKELLQDAAADYDLPDPTRRVRPPASPVAKVRERRALTRDELAALLEAIGERQPEWYPEVYVLAHTGMRPGELYALTWGDIDPAAGWIHIRRAVWRGKVAGTKTGAERRAALTAGISDALRAKPRGLPKALVFPSATGGHRGPQSLLNMLKRLCRSIGMVAVTPYTFRYTFRTLTRDAGAPDELVRAIQGHATPEMGAHYYRASQREAAHAVARFEVPPRRP